VTRPSYLKYESGGISFARNRYSFRALVNSARHLEAGGRIEHFCKGAGRGMGISTASLALSSSSVMLEGEVFSDKCRTSRDGGRLMQSLLESLYQFTQCAAISWTRFCCSPRQFCSCFSFCGLVNPVRFLFVCRPSPADARVSVRSPFRADSLLTGGWLVGSAFTNLQAAFATPGSCLRMPHPAGCDSSSKASQCL
jgi:hypothetical protein